MIFESPKLDFNDFLAYFGKVSYKQALLEILPKIYNAKNAKKAKKAKKANLLQGANAQSATTKAYSTTMAEAKNGGRRWAPPGGLQLNPPPTEGGAGRAGSGKVKLLNTAYFLLLLPSLI